MEFSFKKEILTLPSNDEKTSLSVKCYTPASGEIRAVLQVSHGMTDYVERYEGLASYLAERGVALVGNDHLGHGDTVINPADFGFFASEGGKELLVDDLYTVNRYIRERFGVPTLLLGHSMGSFIARLYAVKYPDSVEGLIIHGTAGKNPALPFGKALVSLLKLFFGERHRSRFVRSLADGGYNKGFDKSEGEGAWLTRDPEMVADRIGNPKNDFIFTLSGYGDLFALLTECNSSAWYSSFPKKLPTLVMSGECDPVGGFGKGVREVHSGLLAAGADVSLKLYAGARHELFNETEETRLQAFADITDFVLRRAEP